MQKNINYIKHQLYHLYPEPEIDSFVFWIFEHLLGYNRTQLLMQKHDVLEDDVTQQIEEIVKRLIKFEPIQYIIGETDFCGLTLKCKPKVLIPRPETEELVMHICQSVLESPIKILDIGTGSGCIALSLKHKLKHAMVHACDVSDEALALAKENALRNNVEVQCFRFDILNEEGDLPNETYDVIVSNPPYVLESEKALMRENVLKYEPHLALFVEDNDALLFYRFITLFACKRLNSAGALWFEINESKGADVAELMQINGFEQVEIINDLFGKARFVKGVKP